MSFRAERLSLRFEIGRIGFDLPLGVLRRHQASKTRNTNITMQKIIQTEDHGRSKIDQVHDNGDRGRLVRTYAKEHQASGRGCVKGSGCSARSRHQRSHRSDTHHEDRIDKIKRQVKSPQDQPRRDRYRKPKSDRPEAYPKDLTPASQYLNRSSKLAQKAQKDRPQPFRDESPVRYSGEPGDYWNGPLTVNDQRNDPYDNPAEQSIAG